MSRAAPRTGEGAKSVGGSATPSHRELLMAKKPQKLTRHGSPDAISIYVAVGVALSYWEATEDVAMGLFKWLCGDAEPVAMLSYTKAPRKVRSAMLLAALDIYGTRLRGGEIDLVKASLKRLDDLSEIRNAIAHGHVSQMKIEENGTVVAEGHYLLPSFNEGAWHERGWRFQNTAESIEKFTKEVRGIRAELHDVHVENAIIEQNDDAEAGGEWYMQRKKALDIASRRIKSSEWKLYMRPIDEWPS